jgi:ribA/ribD-fused uncharacterized protein
MTKDELIAEIAKGLAPSFLFFWGHTPRREGVIDSSCLSQWFPRAFEIDGVRYPTAEHFMMASKAKLFDDDDAHAEILRAKSPAEAKAAGRAVKNYDDKKWDRARYDAVVRGNVYKFGQHTDLRTFLLSTNDRVLVEAAPRDTIWGIGMAASNPDSKDPKKWRGRNLLGFALMEARREIRSWSTSEG